MKLFLTLCLAIFLTLPASAARRIGEAQVRTGKNDLPCFTLAEREEQRNGIPEFQSVTVRDGERIVWHMSMPPERTFPLASSMCITYGGMVQALPQTPAAVLESGIVYTVQLETRPGKSAAIPLRYVARFCLARQTDGKTLVQHIGASGRREQDLRGCHEEKARR
ncbi:hypothetical protein ACHAC9_10050 [Massilia sp. CMS3.1]|uniref:hypothetical protein n=1 Tax=Massilia sp. CMS3.1 TaxID=3373083 RepID=UPI003EE66BDA